MRGKGRDRVSIALATDHHELGFWRIRHVLKEVMPIRENLPKRGRGDALFHFHEHGLAPAHTEDVDPLLRVQLRLLLDRRQVCRIRRLAGADAFSEYQRIEL